MRRTTPWVLALALTGCSLRETATGMVADALSGGGGVFARDGDPELVRDAIPFGLKTYESLLLELPKHKGLLLSCASGFAQYAYAFVLEEADRLDATDLPKARALRQRARALFLRSRDYAFRGLELARPGFGDAFKSGRPAALAMLSKEELPFAYWAGVSWAAALMSAKDDLNLVAELPAAGDLIRRVAELDETWEEGAVHEFLVSYEGGRPEAMGGSAARAREHYAKALAISKGRRASLHLALAETVVVREQNLREFRRLLAAAEAVDPDAVPEYRLVNVLALRRAGWLKSRIPDLFLDSGDEREKQ
jgi:predicted anti-sigma-YlaC factor YlaD